MNGLTGVDCDSQNEKYPNLEKSWLKDIVKKYFIPVTSLTVDSLISDFHVT